MLLPSLESPSCGITIISSQPSFEERRLHGIRPFHRSPAGSRMRDGLKDLVPQPQPLPVTTTTATTTTTHYHHGAPCRHTPSKVEMMQPVHICSTDALALLRCITFRCQHKNSPKWLLGLCHSNFISFHAHVVSSLLAVYALNSLPADHRFPSASSRTNYRLNLR